MKCMSSGKSLQIFPYETNGLSLGFHSLVSALFVSSLTCLKVVCKHVWKRSGTSLDPYLHLAIPGTDKVQQNVCF